MRSKIAKIFTDGHRQFVYLPKKFNFNEREVKIYQDEKTGDIILSTKSKDWHGFIKAAKNVEIPDDFIMNKNSR